MKEENKDDGDKDTGYKQQEVKNDDKDRDEKDVNNDEKDRETQEVKSEPEAAV